MGCSFIGNLYFLDVPHRFRAEVGGRGWWGKIALKIFHGMRPEGRKDRLIDRSDTCVFVEISGPFA